jgi:anti-sigma B factor antagonist
MDLHERAAGSVVIVDMDGPTERDDAGYTGLLVRLRAILERGSRRIVLNVERVTHVDSLLLGVIVEVYASAIRQGGGLKLLHVGPRFHHLLAVTRLDRIFEVFESEDAAVASFRSAAAGKRPPSPSP